MATQKNNYYHKMLYKINDDAFFKALKIIISVIFAYVLFFKTLGSSFTMGVILGICFCSTSDISSNLKDKVLGLSFTAITVPLLSVILTLVYPYKFAFYVVFGLFVFLSSFISLYGQRANQISFALLMGMCLSFIHIADDATAISNGLHMFYGGILYLSVSVLSYLIRPTKYINLQMSIFMADISDYFRLSASFWSNNSDIETIKEKQWDLQIKINDSYQKITQFLEENKNNIINSKNNREVVLASTLLKQIINQAVSTTFKTKEVYEYVSKVPEFKKAIQDIVTEFGNTLSQLSDCIRLNQKFPSKDIFINKYAQLQNQLKSNHQINLENDLYLKNILDYLDNEIHAIKNLERIYSEKNSVSSTAISQQDFQNILNPNPYRLKTLLDNLTFKSSYFRFSFRFVIAILTGLAMGNIFTLKKEYWILLTIVVIMRPGYGLTKSRMYQRILGTLIGGAIGIILLYFITNTLMLSILLIMAMLLGFWFTSSDYKIGVTFITLYVVLMYGILKLGADVSVLYRISDTLIGALIAFLATNFLWPTWEFSSIKQNIPNALQQTKNYVNEFDRVYFQNTDNEIIMQASRQNAFIATTNLMASYQRLVQEPKNKQQNRAQLYQMAVLNQSLIGAFASLGNFIRLHPNNNNFKPFEKIIKSIIYNIDLSLQTINKTTLNQNQESICSSNDILKMQVLQNKQIDLNPDNAQLKEAQLVLTQLSWIVNLSQQMSKTAQTIT